MPAQRIEKYAHISNSVDADTFKAIVDDYQAKVLNTCYRFVNNRQDAEDMTQEVFIEVFRSMAGFRGDAALSTWIYRIAVTKSLDFIRKKKRKKRFAVIQRLFNAGDDAIVDIPHFNTPHAELEQKERAQILSRAVASLPENQCVAVTLHRYEGFSYQEAAEIMGTTVSAIESLLFRAKKNLQKILTDYYNQTME